MYTAILPVLNYVLGDYTDLKMKGKVLNLKQT